MFRLWPFRSLLLLLPPPELDTSELSTLYFNDVPSRTSGPFREMQVCPKPLLNGDVSTPCCSLN